MDRETFLFPGPPSIGNSAYAEIREVAFIDGGTHAGSDSAGIGNGFRDTNMWLAALTNDSLPTTFYAGDALGSFNSIMRFVTGALAGLGISWLTFPYLFPTHAQMSNSIQ